MPMIRRVIRYSGMGYNDVMGLPCDLFLLMYKNSVMDELQATEQGRTYLADCERMNITEPDMDKLREKAGG